jgi:hypothetical protein
MKSPATVYYLSVIASTTYINFPERGKNEALHYDTHGVFWVVFLSFVVRKLLATERMNINNY